jgi:hypothetical protein
VSKKDPATDLPIVRSAEARWTAFAVVWGSGLSFRLKPSTRRRPGCAPLVSLLLSSRVMLVKLAVHRDNLGWF